MTQLQEHENTWQQAFLGKTIQGVRPIHIGSPVPRVNLLFTDGTTYTVSVKEGVYFEGCLINTLRKAQPIVDVLVHRDGFTYTVTLESPTFPLLMLVAVNKSRPSGLFPFDLVAGDSNG